MTDSFARLQEGLADRYALERELGEGGMAVVYLARDLRHERQVAVKLLKPDLAGAIGSERFLREIRIAARLSHPHILPLYDSGDVDGLFYYVMPFVEGESLRDRLTRETQLGLEDALQITREVADALGYAHSRGLIHRDIKPENIMLSGGHALVTDFGIARAVDAAGKDSLTQTGMAIGTPAYMSPEQWTGTERVDGRADLYSLACVLYEMLLGEPPFTGTTPQVVMARATLERPRSVRVVRPNVPTEIELAIERALAKHPADRFATAFQFVEALSTPATARPSADTRVAPAAAPFRVRWRLPSRKVIAAVVFLFVVAITGLLVRLPGGASAGRLRLVVLPFQNLGRPDAEYFADGLTEELTGRLASVTQLSVIARTSSMQYKGTTKTVAQIGDELDVAYVVEGSVRWEQPSTGRGQVRVSARLVKVSDGTQIWGSDYQVAMDEIFAVQSSIAERVAGALDVALAGTELQRVAAKPTANLDAYDAYLRGNSFYHHSWQREDVEAALRMYQRATQLDPRFALAFAQLGKTYAWMHRLDYDTTNAALVNALQAVDSAIALKPDLPEGHLARGQYFYWGRWDLQRAADEMQAALRLRPGDAGVLLNIGNVRRRQGAWEDAYLSFQRAAELDPRSQAIWHNLGETYLYTRRYDLAERNLDRVRALAPNLLDNYLLRAALAVERDGDVAEGRRIMLTAEERIPPTGWRPLWGYWLTGFSRLFYPSLEEALRRLRPGEFGLDSSVYYAAKAEAYGRAGDLAPSRLLYDSARTALMARLATSSGSDPDDAWIFGALGVVNAALGRSSEAIGAAQRAVALVPVAKDAFDGPDWVVNLARVYLMLGDRAKAMDNLELALAVPSRISANWVRLDPVWTPLRGDPRFQRLIAESRK